MTTPSHLWFAMIAGWPLAIGVAGAAQAAVDDPVEIMADVVLIADDCHELVVDYGTLFRFAERRGLAPVDVMPLGSHRLAFDAARATRARTMPLKTLCGDLADERGLTVPGVFARR